MDIFNSRCILKEKRWLWIDYDKGISIILVAFNHCYEVLDEHHLALVQYPFFNYMKVFLYGFRMPLFFMISGMLVTRSLNKKGLGTYIKDRLNFILYPLLVWGFLQITLQILSSRFSNNGIGPVYYLYLIIDPRLTGHFWYLNALFCIGAIFSFIKAKLKIKPLVHFMIGLVLFAVSAGIHINNLRAGIITDICEYYCFFAVGDLISNQLLADDTVRRLSSWKVFFPLFIIFLAIQYICTNINLHPGNNLIADEHHVEYKLPALFIIEALVGVCLSINASFLLQKYRKFTFLRIVGYHSLFIYCMHIIIMTVARNILVPALHITYVPALIITLWSSGIILPIIFYRLCMRYNLWWFFTFKRPEKQEAYLQKNNIFNLSFKRNIRDDRKIATVEAIV